MSSASPKGQEPSMEEILASIRRIIADDQPSKTEPKQTQAEPEPELAAPAPLEDDILDLDDEASADLDEVMFADAEPEAEPEPEPVAPPPPPPEPPRLATPAPPPEPLRLPDPDALLSQQTDRLVGQAFHTLAGSVLAGSQRTLDDIVREMLRPMLKEWLDDNLPTIVERLVRSEIERVARGGR